MAGKGPPKTAKRKPAKKAAPAARKGSSPSKTAPGNDWRGKVIERVRSLIREAVPDVIEEVKWRKPSNAMQGVPVWSRNGILCTGETYKGKVKFTFAKGAALADPNGLFNADDKGSTRRAIDVREGDAIDAAAFKALVREASELNEG